jgi:ParB-like chromosome segregation protein Spo0J
MAAKRSASPSPAALNGRHNIPEHPQPEGRAAAIWVPIEKLRRWAGNPRDNAAAIRKAMRSIRRYGFGAPLLARIEDQELIAGDTRIQAAVRLGMTELPVRYMTLDERNAHALAIADNRIGEEADWDDEKLAKVVLDLEAHDVDTHALGMDEEELDKILEPEPEGGDAADEERDLGETYQVIVTCDNEDDQALLLEELKDRGLKVKALLA